MFIEGCSLELYLCFKQFSPKYLANIQKIYKGSLISTASFPLLNTGRVFQ